MRFKERGIQVKIILGSLASILLLGVCVSLIAVKTTRSALVRNRLDQLTSIREGTREHIENYMDLMGRLLASLAADETVRTALAVFEEGFYRIADEVPVSMALVEQTLTDFYGAHYLNHVNYDVPRGADRRPAEAYLPKTGSGRIAQYLYIAKNPHPAGERDALLHPPVDDFAYGAAHARFHPTLKTFLHNFDLYDIFIIDLKGTVLYTDFKEQDFVTNLLDGPYRDTGLARTFRAARKLAPGGIAFDDFRPYEPSYNLPASFIGTPIAEEGAAVGVLIVQIPIDRINRIMTFGGNYESAGLGKSGESYLVGPDGMMRNDSRFIDDLRDPLVRRLGTTIGVLAVETPAARRALAGQSGTDIMPDYRAIPVLSSYAPARIFDQRWAVIAEIDRAEGLAPSAAITRDLLFAALPIIGLIMGAVSLFLVHQFSRPLSRLIDRTRELSEHGGDLTQEIPVRSGDEVGRLAGYFNAFIATLRAQMIRIKNATDVLNEAVQDLSATSREVETTANAQAASVKEVVSTMEDSDRLSKHVETRIQEVTRTADETREAVETGFSVIRDNKEKMEDIREANQRVIDGIKGLGDHVKNIWEIVGVVNAVAEQTKIIAFNAELEASAAGEAGKSFEIVATEIRRLADNTRSATSEIKGRIVEIQKAADDLILTSEEGTERIAQGWRRSTHLEEVFGGIQSSSETSAESARTITESIYQQVQAFEQILLTLKQISEGIDHFVSSAAASTRSSERLREMAGELDAIVAEYTV